MPIVSIVIVGFGIGLAVGLRVRRRFVAAFGITSFTGLRANGGWRQCGGSCTSLEGFQRPCGFGSGCHQNSWQQAGGETSVSSAGLSPLQQINCLPEQIGLSDHATVHHGCWYSTWDDRFVAILEVDLEAKWLRVYKGQVHRRCCVDPAEVG